MGIHDEVGPRVDALLAQARRHLEKAEYDDAARCYGLVTEASPERWEGFMGLAHASLALGRPADALEYAPAAIAREPGCLPAYQLMAQLGMDGGVADKAIEALEYGAYQLPNEPQLFEWLVMLYAETGRDDDLVNCLAHYARLRGLSGRDAALLFSRAPSLAESTRHRITSAARMLR